MKKLILLLISCLLLLGCQQTALTEGADVVGEYSYFVERGPYGFAKSAEGELCFTPAQLSDMNGGDMFCFSNREHALSLLGFDDVELDDACMSYSGIAEIMVNNITEIDPNITKGSLCFELGTCPYNRADLTEVVELLETPNCRKK